MGCISACLCLMGLILVSIAWLVLQTGVARRALVEWWISLVFLQGLKLQKTEIEGQVDRLASEAARDLGLELGKTLKLEWHK